MKKIKYLLFAIFLLIPIGVSADTIYNIDMKVVIDKYGDAEINEVWDVKADSGSEWFKSYNNMGNMILSDFSVSMDGKKLKEKDLWNIDESLSDKAGYYGINYTDDGKELCFGKSDFNRHKFTLNYKLSDYVFTTNDSDIIYANLMGKGNLKNWNIIVTSYYNFPDSLDVWGFGHKGLTYVSNGKIILTSNNKYELNNEYIVLLAKFPKGTFDTFNTYSQYNTFNDVYSKAKEGSFENNYNDEDDNYIDNTDIYDEDENENNSKDNDSKDFIFRLGLGIGFIIIIVLVACIPNIAMWIFLGIFLNKYSKLKTGKGTAIAWIPVINVYVLGKLAFNKIVGWLLVVLRCSIYFYGIISSLNTHLDYEKLNSIQTFHILFAMLVVLVVTIYCVIKYNKDKKLIGSFDNNKIENVEEQSIKTFNNNNENLNNLQAPDSYTQKS